MPPSTIQQCATWLQQEGPDALKSRQWTHPTVVFVLTYTIMTIVAFVSHDYLIPPDRAVYLEQANSNNNTSRQERQWISRIVLTYTIGLFWCRLRWLSHPNTAFPAPCILYDFTWLCNQTMVIGSIGLYLDRPYIATAFCVTVGIDHFLWYVDLICYALTGRFAVGVVKYLFWPTATWLDRLGSTHHLWTTPVFVYAARGVIVQVLPLALLYMVVAVSLSRILTPYTIQIPDRREWNGMDNGGRGGGGGGSDRDKHENDKTVTKYSNINLAWELWKDVKIKALQISYDDPPVGVYLMRLWFVWAGCTLLIFAGLFILSRVAFGSPETDC